MVILAAKIWRHAGRVGVSYSGHYEEKGIFERLMGRLRAITAGADGFAPDVHKLLCTGGPMRATTYKAGG